MTRTAYLDHATCTPTRREVLDRMLPHLCANYGHPDSQHAQGRKARRLIEEARSALAKRLNCQAQELFFSQDADQANQLALLSLARNHGCSGAHILTTSSEPESVLSACAILEREGFRVTYLSLEDGRLDLNELEQALDEETFLLSLSLVNHHYGTVQPLAELAQRFPQLLIHSDARHACWRELEPATLGAHALTFCSQVIAGPSGAGALWLDPRLSLKCQWNGRPAPQENTNLVAIVGFAQAFCLLADERADLVGRWQGLRQLLSSELTEHGCVAQGEHPGFVTLAVTDLDCRQLLVECDARGLCVASPGQGLLRFSLGRDSTRSDAEFACEVLRLSLEHLRAQARWAA